ncbi:MAG: UDP-N-acetylmuramate dehydrogenase [Candidatus Buchananbacteria bacterium]|nr:UDP-N-acetylmuramate dehydrogenase [Candidatus Buchananbacteria bacterium]
MPNLKELLPTVQENVSLAEQCTYKLGGPARYFYLAKSSEDLLKAIQAATKLGIEYTVIGWGSNILIADLGYDGLVIKNLGGKLTANGEEIIVESGVDLSKLVDFATKKGLTGLEFASGIPGTVGGAVYGNAGAYGSSFSEIVTEVTVYQAGEIKKMSNRDMGFGYRHSILKEKPALVLSVILKLKKGDQKEIAAKVREIIKQREAKLPSEPSCGCVFKNIELDKVAIDKAKVIKGLDISEEEWNEATKYGKLSSGYIIDRLGLKDKKIGGCHISSKHGAYIVNTEHARAEHVIMLISEVKMKVRNATGIQLQEEVQYLGF